MRAAGFALEVTLCRRVYGDDRVGDRGSELVEVLRLAEEFPARHSPELAGPVFGRVSGGPVSGGPVSGGPVP